MVTTGRSWGKFSLISLCGTGLRFGRDVRQNVSVLTNLAEIKSQDTPGCDQFYALLREKQRILKGVVERMQGEL